MLANAIFLPDASQAHRKFKRTEVYLDTSLLIFALGYAGETRRKACSELFHLLYPSGADLRCFRHTLEEARGVLDACAQILRSGQLRNAYGPSIHHFVSSGTSASDVEMFSVRLEKDLAGLRIRVVEKPPYEKEYVIDEAGLSRQLDEAIDYREKARDRDVDSISAIMRLRKGEEFFFVEECRAIFITTNLALIRTANQFFYKEASPRAVGVSMSDHTLTNLLWLKTPNMAPDLPRHRIIADCFAATQPDEQLFRKYLTEIDKLQKNHTITVDDVYLLRYSQEARNALMRATLGEEDALTEGTVPEILAEARAKIQGQMKHEFEAESKLRRDAEDREQALSSQISARELQRAATLRNRAEAIAAPIVTTLKSVVLIALSVGALTTFPWKLPSVKATPVLYAISLAQFLLFILTLVSLQWGTTVKGIARSLEDKIAGWILRLFLRLTGEQPASSPVGSILGLS